MLNGTYDSYAINVTLNSNYTTVTFTSLAYVNSGSGSAVQGGATNAYTVFNDGTIVSRDASGIELRDGGSITNGDSDHTSALISGQGYFGIKITGNKGTVVNYATITGNSVGIVIQPGGTVSNTGTGALIRGGVFGVEVDSGYASVQNAGTIEGGSTAVYLYDGGSVTNSGTSALITGGRGVYIQGAGTVTNYGTITGTNGTAIQFTSSSDVLVVEAGSTLSGYAAGSGGTLLLAGDAGAGTVSGIGTQYRDFSRITVASGATWTLTGSETIGGPMSLVDSGALTITNTLTVEGALTVDGSLVNDGSIAGVVTLLSGGYLDNAGTGAVIQGAGVAVQMMGGAASVYNQGTIEGTGLPGDGIDLGNGGSVTDNGAALADRGHPIWRLRPERHRDRR